MTGDQATGDRMSGDRVTGDRVIDVQINGDRHALPEGATLLDAVGIVTDAPTGIAAAVDDGVVPRSLWSSTALRAGARVEVLTAVQGG